MSINYAIIPAAGYGKRMAIFTNYSSKEMLKIDGIPVIDFAIKEAYESGCRNIGIIIREDKKDLVNHIKTNWFNIKIIWQNNPRGLGDAILKAREFINNNPFGIILPDDIVESPIPALKQLINYFQNFKCAIIGILDKSQSWHPMFSYNGEVKILRFGNNNELFYVKSKDCISTYNVKTFGRYIFTPDIFFCQVGTKDNFKGEIDEGPFLSYLISKNSLLAYVIKGKCFTIGIPSGYIYTLNKLNE